MLDAFGLNPRMAILGLYVLMGGATYLVYREDKFRARRGRRRIPESTLHGLELCFGWFGAWLAQQTLVHKTSKKSYQREFWTIGSLHLLLIVVMLLVFDE